MPYIAAHALNLMKKTIAHIGSQQKLNSPENT